eukprot:EG_transcript_11998
MKADHPFRAGTSGQAEAPPPPPGQPDLFLGQRQSGESPDSFGTVEPDCTACLGRCCGCTCAAQSAWWCPSYVADWLLLAVFGAAILVMMLLWEPTERPYQAATRQSDGQFAFNDNEFQFALRADTFAEWVTGTISVAAPCAIALLYHVVRRFGPSRDKSMHDLHHFGLGMATTVVLAYFAWVPINRVVGAFRPDLWARLQTGDPALIRDGRKSFPSGHTLVAFGGLGFFAHWLSGKLRTFHPARGNLWRLALGMLCPMALAVAQAVSRVTDNRHRTVDIIGGCLLGTGAALLGYHLHYPPLHAPDCDRPRNRKAGLRPYLLGRAATTPTAIRPRPSAEL